MYIFPTAKPKGRTSAQIVDNSSIDGETNSGNHEKNKTYKTKVI